MKAVNLIPADARRQSSAVRAGSLGASHFLVALAAIVVVVVLLRVLADNTVSSRQATLSAVKAQVTAEQAEASRLSVYTSFVQAAEQREAQVRTLADSRFPWQRSFDQLAHVLPADTSLTSLTASTTGGTAAATAGATAAVDVPTFSLVGCAHASDQDGVATVIRHLRGLTGATSVNFTSSTRQPGCGDAFDLSVSFGALASGAAVPTGAATPSTAVPATPAPPTTPTTTTTTVQPAAATTTTPLPTDGTATTVSSGGGS